MANYMFNNPIPEFQGLTESQQAEFTNRMAQAADQLNRTQARSNQGSSGALFAERRKLGTQRAQGLTDIYRRNALEGALLGRQERLTNEARDWQAAQAERAYQRQRELMDYQNEINSNNMFSQMLGGAFGTIGGGLLGPILGRAGQAIGNIGVAEKPDYMSMYLKKQLGLE